jgi:hypothetical protein
VRNASINRASLPPRCLFFIPHVKIPLSKLRTLNDHGPSSSFVSKLPSISFPSCSRTQVELDPACPFSRHHFQNHCSGAACLLGCNRHSRKPSSFSPCFSTSSRTTKTSPTPSMNLSAHLPIITLNLCRFSNPQDGRLCFLEALNQPIMSRVHVGSS